MSVCLARRSRARQLFFSRVWSFRRSSTMEEKGGAPPAKRAHMEGEGLEGASELPDADHMQGASAAALPISRRRKCILLLAYNGKGYLGMQRNPGVRTIEEDLLEALLKAEAIPEQHRDNLGSLQFQRCARTDKGVSAARQVVSLKMVPDVEMVAKINEHLSPQIRVMGLKRVTKGFNSKTQCSARTYEYLLPTLAFAPYRLTTLDYRIDETTAGRVGDLLRLYQGTHNFHNFTSGKKFEEDSARRYILSFQSGERFLAHSKCGQCSEKREVEFMSLYVKGQSFMLHQIRKMIGLVIAVVRGSVTEDVIVRAYAKEKIDIPRAPSLGLLLDNVHFDRYNYKIAGDGLHELLKWDEYEEQMQAFKKEHIYQTIIDTEISQLSMMQWLGSLQIHEFFQTQGRLRKEAKELEEGASAKEQPGEEQPGGEQPGKEQPAMKLPGEEENGSQEKQSAGQSTLLPVEATPCVEQPVSDASLQQATGQHSSSALTWPSEDSSESIMDQECGASLQTRNSDVARQSCTPQS